MSYSPVARCLFFKLVRDRYLTNEDDRQTVSSAAQALSTISTDTSASAKEEKDEETAYEIMMERVKEAEVRLARLKRNISKVSKINKSQKKRVHVDKKRQKNIKRRRMAHDGGPHGHGCLSQQRATLQTRENDEEESQRITAKIRRLVGELEALTEETSSMTHESGIRAVKVEALRTECRS